MFRQNKIRAAVGVAPLGGGVANDGAVALEVMDRHSFDLVIVDLDELDLAPIAAPMHLADHHLRQRFGGIPEEVEFFLDPRHAFWRFVLPQDFVVALPAAARLVHRPNEAQPAAIRQGNHAGLAVNKAADVVRRDAHRLPMLSEEGI